MEINFQDMFFSKYLEITFFVSCNLSEKSTGFVEISLRFSSVLLEKSDSSG